MSTTAGSLHFILRRLADEGVPVQERRALERELASLLASQLRDKLRGWTDRHDLIDEALDHTTERAARRDNGYRGANGEASAWTWVLGIAKNHVRDRLRKEETAARAWEQQRLEAERDEAERRDEQERFEHAKDAHRRLLELCTSGRHPSAWNEYVNLAFTARWTDLSDGDELVTVGRYDRSKPDPVEEQRARDRLAQKRRRGRLRTGELLVALYGEDSDEAAALAKVLRAPYPPPPRDKAGDD